MCIIDAMFVMYAIGGGMLGWFGVKALKKYNHTKKNANGKPTEIGYEEATS